MSRKRKPNEENHNSQTLICNACKFEAATLDAIIAHLRDEHQIPEETTRSAKGYMTSHADAREWFMSTYQYKLEDGTNLITVTTITRRSPEDMANWE